MVKDADIINIKKLMKEKNDFITNISNRCLKLIASNKINMVDIAYKMGIRTIDLYNILLNNNEDISIYLKLYLLLQK